MKTIAFIPVRGGSHSIPLKNIKMINEKPLVYWSLIAAEQCSSIDEIIVATDHQKIEEVVLSFELSKVKIYRRNTENARHESSTESVMVEYLSRATLQSSVTSEKIKDNFPINDASILKKGNLSETAAPESPLVLATNGSKVGASLKMEASSEDLFCLIQATNPFLKKEHLDEAMEKIKAEPDRSLLSVVRSKRFFWSGDGRPINYNIHHRPRRQDFDGWLMENGSFYVNSVGKILKSHCRICDQAILYEMPEISGFEIDEPHDWIICEELLRQYSRNK